MSSACVTLSDPVSVRQRLAALGVTEFDLSASVNEGVGYILACTSNDPPSLAGLLGWGKATRGLRDRLIPKGGKRTNVRRQAATVTPKGIVIVVAAGDSRTGREGPMPSTRSAKGPATVAAVENNVLQLSLMDANREFAAEIARVQTPTTWFLLYYWDEQHHEVRIELSLPDNMDDDGYVDAWVERLLLASLPVNRKPQAESEDESNEDDAATQIDVRRRQSG